MNNMNQYDRQQVELYFSCRGLLDLDLLSKSDSMIKVYLCSKKGWSLLGKTEVIHDNLNPDYSTSIVTDYIFEITQTIKVEVVDIDGPNKEQFIGEAQFELGELMGSKKNMLIIDLINNKKTNKKGGKIIVRSEATQEKQDKITMSMKCEKLDFGNFFGGVGESFLVIYKPKVAFGNTGTANQSELIKVYQTETFPDGKYPQFKNFWLNSSK